MSFQLEYEICLVKLVLPVNQSVKKITLSVSGPSFQYFIENERIVKNQKVNFFRERVFLPSVQEGLSFHIYSTDSLSGRHLLQTFTIEPSQLSSIKKRAALFHTLQSQYELVWECGVFSGQGSEENEETDREYTEFRKNSQLLGQEFLIDSVNTSNQGRHQKSAPKLFRRSTSAESSRNSQADLTEMCLDTLPLKSKGQSMQSKDDSHLLTRSMKKQQGSTRRGGFKNFFSFINSGIAVLLSFSE